MSWTDKRVQTLETMWRAGKSASEIAETLGGVTRNAVIGKAHRMGLSGRPSPIKKVKEKPAAAVAAEAPSAPAAPVARAKPVAIPVPSKDGGVSILQLTERMCKWPNGDPREADFHFCGQASKPGMPYCVDHVAVAYQSGGRNSNRNTAAVAAVVAAEVPVEHVDAVDDEADAA